MFKLLASSWAKKRVFVDPLQCTMEFSRNFPLDLASEANTCATLINCGLPKQVAFSQLSFIDDVDYVMELIEQEEDGIPKLDAPGQKAEQEQEEEEEKPEKEVEEEGEKEVEENK